MAEQAKNLRCDFRGMQAEIDLAHAGPGLGIHHERAQVRSGSGRQGEARTEEDGQGNLPERGKVSSALSGEPQEVTCVTERLRGGLVLATERGRACGEAEEIMDGLYYKVIALVLLFPWALFGLTLVGYWRGHTAHKTARI